MTSYVENETMAEFAFSVEETVKLVMEEVLDSEKCPYEAEINVLLTDNEEIRQYNMQYRGIDRETDVLSFPNLSYEKAADFDTAAREEADCFNPETGELILGDIIVSVDKIKEQAGKYGHSEHREFAFLIAHSMLHLCGYDHMEEKEAAQMEAKQEAVLKNLGITRD